VIKELAQYIENNTSWVIGTNLFSGSRPQDAPDTCITLLQRVGSLVNFALDKNHTETAFIQVLTRSTDYHTAETHALTVHNILCGKSNAGILLPAITSGGNTHRINSCEGTKPAWLGEDDRNRDEFTANYVMHIEDG